MSEIPNTFFNLVERIEDAFAEIDSDVVTALSEINCEYAHMKEESEQLKKDYPIIEKLLNTDDEITLTADEHKVLARYNRLTQQMEDIERQNIYFRGHTDCFAYLKKIGVI